MRKASIAGPTSQPTSLHFMSRPVPLAGVAIAMLLTVYGCGEDSGHSTNPDSMTCADFMALPDRERDSTVRELATDLDVPDAVTPLGRPNVEYHCTQDPSMTVAESVKLIGGDAPPPPLPRKLVILALKRGLPPSTGQPPRALSS